MIFKLAIYAVSSLVIALMKSSKFPETKRVKSSILLFLAYTAFLLIFDYLFFSVSKLYGALFIIAALIPFLFIEIKKSAQRSKF